MANLWTWGSSNYDRISTSDWQARKVLKTAHGRDIQTGDDSIPALFGSTYEPTEYEMDRFRYDNMKLQLRKYKYDEIVDDFQTLYPISNWDNVNTPRRWRNIGKHMVTLRLKRNHSSPFTGGFTSLYGFVMDTDLPVVPREPFGSVRFFIPYLQKRLTVPRRIAESVRTEAQRWPEVKDLLGSHVIGWLMGNGQAEVDGTLRENGLDDYDHLQPGPGDYGVTVRIPYHKIESVLIPDYEQGTPGPSHGASPAGTGDLEFDSGPQDVTRLWVDDDLMQM